MSFLDLRKSILKNRTIKAQASMASVFSGFSSVTYGYNFTLYKVLFDKIVFFETFLNWSAATGSPSDVRVTGYPLQKIAFPVTPMSTVVVGHPIESGFFSNIDATDTMYGITMIDEQVAALPQFVVYNKRSNAVDFGGKLPVGAITSGTFPKTLHFSGWYFTNGAT